MPLKDFSGQKIGKLEVLKRAPNKITGGKNRTMWTCQCDCGNNIDVSSDYLKRSECPSCGCETTRMK